MLYFIKKLFGSLSAKGFLSCGEGGAILEMDSLGLRTAPRLADAQARQPLPPAGSTVEMATGHQLEFLKELGFSGKGMTRTEAEAFLHRILRPAKYALGKTFKNPHCLSQAELLSLQIALVRWPGYPQLPRYIPHPGGQPRTSPHRNLTVEERTFILDTAQRLLPPDTFAKLKINRVKKNAR